MDYYQRLTIFESFERLESHDQVLSDFICRELIPTIDRFVAMYRVDERYLCHVDFSNLTGDLILKYCEVVETYERVRYSDCHWNRVNYIFNSLRRETNRLLHKNLRQFMPSHLKDKHELAVSPDKWKEIDMDVRYCQPDLNEFQFDMERWTDNEREFLRLSLEKNSIVDISKLMDMSYSSARRIKDRLKERVSEENRSKEGKRHPRIA